MKEIVFFSNNQNKILEIESLFLNLPYKLLSLNNFKNILSPKETGISFRENAKIKSNYGKNKLKKLCFADDSGICIEALDNLPGVKSKEFLNSKKFKKKVFENILIETKNKKKFGAFFQSTICLSLTSTKHIFFDGKINGEISKEIKGDDGFGYDPIFIPKGSNKTFAEMTLDEKNLFSHRAIAVKKLVQYLSRLI